MTTPTRLAGILPPHMVPLDARGRINEDELARYVSWLIDKGVHGLYPNGSTGEFTRFTAEERRRIVSVGSTPINITLYNIPMLDLPPLNEAT